MCIKKEKGNKSGQLETIQCFKFIHMRDGMILNAGNLLGQDITPAQVINQLVEINKYFRNHHIPGALLSEIQMYPIL